MSNSIVAFTKGHSKIGGRAKGVPNRSTSDYRAILRDVLEKELQELGTNMSAIKSPERRLELTFKLLPYVLPKVQEISLDLLPESTIDKIFNILSNDKECEN